MATLSIMSTENDAKGKRWHVFDTREGQTVGALVSRNHKSLESALAWACETYGLSLSDFLPPETF